MSAAADTDLTQVVVLISCYNEEKNIPGVLGTLWAQPEPGIDLKVVLVDNACTDQTGPLAKKNYPQTDVIRLEPNKGFTGGNNFGWDYIQKTYPRAPYVLLLNADTEVAPGWLSPLVTYMNAHPEVGSVQPQLMLHPKTDCFNTTGNRCHYLGFGYMENYGKVDDGSHNDIKSLDFASGAAVMLRTELLQDMGLFDEGLYMYLEDTELTWKLRQAGHDTMLIPQSVVYHKYISNAPTKYYYYLERNRWILLLTFYQWSTLFFILPALLAMEAGQTAYALCRGLLWAKIRSWLFFLSPGNLKWVAKRRKAVQNRRVMADHPFMTRFSGTIHFEAIENPLLTYVGNPLMAAWWAVARPLILFWSSLTGPKTGKGAA